ncbi:MAG: hypothetical protein KBD24_02180 [Candidatus Pacebacteria bacterium]|nr:hypothetical protein [Candidatus Paceibacterota bacterium]
MPTTKKTVVPKVVVQKKVAPKMVAKVAPVMKKAIKKTVGVTKKVAPKKMVCACTTCCTPEEAFWVNNGPIIESIVQLKQAFLSMSDEQYAYHTMREGNDFARWIRECLHDTERANRLAEAKTKSAAIRALNTACCK